MKKIISAVCLLLALIMSIPAFAAPGDAVIARRDSEGFNDYIESVATVGDVLYLFSSNAAYTFKVGDTDMKRLEWDIDLSAYGEDAYNSNNMAFIDGDKLYRIQHLMKSDEKSYALQKTLITEVQEQDGKLVAKETREITWPDELIERYDNSVYPRGSNTSFALNGILYMLYYGDRGYALGALDLQTMKFEQIEPKKDLEMICPYIDGKLLVVESEYTEKYTSYFSVYDPATKSMTEMCQKTYDSYRSMEGLACDTATGQCYITSDGGICPLDLNTGEVGEPVVDILSTGGSRNGWILEGGYYAYSSYEATFIRNLHPTEKPSTRLKVYDGVYFDGLVNAYFDYTNAHGDVSIALTRDYTERQNLVENMMNRESSTDIYLMPMTDTKREALYDRGYMMELDGSQKIKDLVAQMYPTMQEQFCKNGKVVMLPVQAYAWSVGFYPKALAKLGLKMEDIPTNWFDFLDFLATLPQYLEGTDVHILYAGMTQRDFRNSLFYQIFSEYTNYINYTMDVPKYNTELFRTLIEKLDKIDYAALGLVEDEETDEGLMSMVRSISYTEDSQLFELSTGISLGNFYGDCQPILMAMDANTKPVFSMEVYAAFINPFTKNPEVALSFMEALADKIPEATLYNFIPTLSEPIRSSYYEESKKSIEEMYEATQKQYDEAEPADKQALEEQLESIKREKENLETYYWTVSPEQIEWFRANDDDIICSKSNWLYNDESGEAYQLIQQFLDKQIDANQLLTSIDKKVQMMAMEGN